MTSAAGQATTCRRGCGRSNYGPKYTTAFAEVYGALAKEKSVPLLVLEDRAIHR